MHGIQTVCSVLGRLNRPPQFNILQKLRKTERQRAPQHCCVNKIDHGWLYCGIESTD